MLRSVLISIVFLGCVSIVHAEVVIETVTVGNPANANDTHGDGYGGVDYVYNIDKFEVTAGQYTEFLNAVAATDSYGLYNPSMDSDPYGCQITQDCTGGSCTYDFSGRPSGTEADWAERPVNYVSWGDAARFCNWLYNGQPVGAQDLTTTEDGSYFLDGVIGNSELIAVIRKSTATWVIPSEDEWYKAAYHKSDGVAGNYYVYPTSSDSVPGFVGDGEQVPEPDPGNYATYNGDSGDEGIGPPYYRTEIGEHENSASPYGTFDQGGNIWEWNETALYGWYRGMRGGSFDDEYETLRAAEREYYYVRPMGEDYIFGFRIAEVPQVKSDIDFDGDVDLDDYTLFRDVGLHDYALLQAAFTGAQR